MNLESEEYMRSTTGKLRKDSRFPLRAPIIKELHRLGLSLDQIAQAMKCSMATVILDCARLGLRGRHSSSRRKKQFRTAVLQFAQTRFTRGNRGKRPLGRPKNLQAMAIAIGLEIRIGWAELRASINAAAKATEQMVRPVVPDHAAGYLRFMETMTSYDISPIKASDLVWNYFRDIADSHLPPPSTWTEMRDSLIGQMVEQYRAEVRPIWTNQTVETIDQMLRSIPEKHASILRRYYGIGQDPGTVVTIARASGDSRSQVQSALNVAQRHVFRSAAYRQLEPTIWRVCEKTDVLLEQRRERQELLQLRLAGPEKECDRLQLQLAEPVTGLDLSVRTANCLQGAGIKTLGQLVAKSEREMLHYRNFGQKCLRELQQVLAKQGLRLGMNLSTSVPKIDN